MKSIRHLVLPIVFGWMSLLSPALAIVDQYGDGMSDIWKVHFGMPVDSSADPNADPDGDGWTNLQESIAGTNPFSANPPEGKLQAEITPNPVVAGVYVVSWPTLVGKRYTLYVSPDLSGGSWTGVGDGEIGDGSPIEMAIDTASGGTPPDKLFWRVSVADVDSDDDGLSDYEEGLLGTNPHSKDTDGDGVSDWDEVNEGSNPLTALDSDSDGIPDDFEKHLARLLLAYNSDPSYWGAYYAGLVAGDLDATHDYTGDGMSAADLAATIAPVAKAESIPGKYRIEIQDRINSIPSWAIYYPDYDEVYGVYHQSDSENVPLSSFDDFNSAYLTSRIGAVTWKNLAYQQYQSFDPSDPHFIGYPAWSGFEMLTNSDFISVQGIINQRRFRLVATDPSHPTISNDCLKLTTKDDPLVVPISEVLVSAEMLKVELPAGRMVSDWYEFDAPMVDGQDTYVKAIPVTPAPDVVPVNSGFNEGRIDATTSYAIPDCDDIVGVDPLTGSGNTEMVLQAVRNHLDGKYSTGDLATGGLVPGWFGVKPGELNKTFWDGGTVTISQVSKIDSDTGLQESGRVRFYGIWDGPTYRGMEPYDLGSLAPVDLVAGGVNKAPSESVYGSNSQIQASGANLYIEGVRPGKITLKWRFQKGAIDVSSEQSFLVCTQKKRADWRDDVTYQIRLQTKVKNGVETDIRMYDPRNGFLANYDYVRAMYYYYRQLFQQMPEKFMWAGMAKTAAAPIYAGMNDLTEWWVATQYYTWDGSAWATGLIAGDETNRDVGLQIFINQFMLQGQIDIFKDMAWEHLAYQSSGIGSIRYVVAKEDPFFASMDAWEEINSGILESNPTLIGLGSRNLLQHEQRDVVQTDYDILNDLWLEQPPLARWVGAVSVPENGSGFANAAIWLSANSTKNPLNPSTFVPTFQTTVSGGRLDHYADRWEWTSNPTDGMFELWSGTSSTGPNFTPAMRLDYASKTLKNAASNYSFDSPNIPNE